MFSKNLQILDLQPQISLSLEQLFVTVGQNNFGNKIPLVCSYILVSHYLISSKSIGTLFSMISVQLCDQIL